MREPASIELPADELLMQAVVARAAEFADPSVAKGSVWASIAASIGDARFSTGHAVQSHVSWLQRVWLNDADRVHGDLTDSLKQLIAQYRDTRASSRCRYQKTPGSKRRHVTVFEKAAVRRQKTRKVVTNQSNSGEIKGSEEADEPEEEDEVDGLFSSLARTKKKQADLDATLEEKVMRIVLRHAPRLETEAKSKIWDDIARESRGRYLTGNEARARTAFLCRVRRNPDHALHGRMTPTLNKLLTEFLKLEPSPHRRAVDSEASQATPRAKKRKQQLKRKRNRRDDESDTSEDSSEEDELCSEMSGTEAPQLPTDREIEALLRELLRIRPFRAGRDRISDEWERVAVAMRSIFGTGTALRTGNACLVHMNRLLHAFRHPNAQTAIQVPDSQAEMASLLDKLIKTRWPRSDALKTHKHRELERQIDRTIKKTQDLQGAGKEALMPRSDFADGITSLRSSFAKCRATMSLQIDSFERERQEHRTEWHTAMAMLKEERQVSQCATAAVLEILKQEQQDRRHEFDALMQLVTTSGFQQL